MSKKSTTLFFILAANMSFAQSTIRNEIHVFNGDQYGNGNYSIIITDITDSINTY